MSSATTMNHTTNISYLEEYDISSVQKTIRIHLDKGEDGWIIVTSPDIKSLITQGEDETSAIKNAYEVVEILKEEKELDKDIKLVIYSRISD